MEINKFSTSTTYHPGDKVMYNDKVITFNPKYYFTSIGKQPTKANGWTDKPLRKDQIKMIRDCQKTGEPTITFKASDLCMLFPFYKYYEEINKHQEIPKEFKDDINDMLGEFLAWREKNLNLVKLPD